jgi:uncharacterized RDD family membrane protein YckC
MRSFLFPFGLKPKPIDDGPRYADIYERGFAAVLDMILIFFLFGWLFRWQMGLVYSHMDYVALSKINPQLGIVSIVKQLWDAGVVYWWFVNFAVQALIIGVIYVLYQIKFDSTPGRWLLGLKIVHRDAHDKPMETWRYVLRFAAYAVSVAPLMLGLFWAAFRKDRRTFHDFIAGTVVLNTRPRGWYWQQIKRGFRYVKGRLYPQSGSQEQAMAEPAAEQRHENGKDPVA